MVLVVIVLLVSVFLLLVPMVPHDSLQLSWFTARKSYENLEEVPRIWEGEGSRLSDFSDFLELDGNHHGT